MTKQVKNGVVADTFPSAFADAFLNSDGSDAPEELLNKFISANKKYGQKEVQSYNASVSFRTAQELKKQNIL